MRIKIEKNWQFHGRNSGFGFSFGYTNNSQRKWHYHLVYLGLFIAIISWGDLC